MVRSGGVSRLRLTVVRGTVYSADRVFVRTEGGVSTLRLTVVGETVYSASRVFVGWKGVSRLRLLSPTSSTTEEWLVSTSRHCRGIVSLSCRSEFRIAMEFLDCAGYYSSHGARRMSNVIRRRRMGQGANSFRPLAC